MESHCCLIIIILQAMELAARQMNVDVLISGHTHVCKIYEKNDIFYVNPGSATGAISLTERFPVLFMSFIFPICCPDVLTCFRVISFKFYIKNLNIAIKKYKIRLEKSEISKI